MNLSQINQNKHNERSDVGYRLRIVRDYVYSYMQRYVQPAVFAQTRTYCMFIGHARSGHSIIGALLDAHPNIILPDEVDTLRYVSAGFSKQQIFHVLLSRSQRQARKGRVKDGRNGKTYSYFVPGQWQGRFDTISVVGDSKAGRSTQRMTASSQIIDQLRTTMQGVDVKLLHIIRNPYDNISTLMMRGNRTFENATGQYFANCVTLRDIGNRFDDSHLLQMRQEDFIADPRTSLQKLCAFLGVHAGEEYLEACCSIVYKDVPKSRHHVAWNRQHIDHVQHLSREFRFLDGYTFDS